jgi:hypothetical protein
MQSLIAAAATAVPVPTSIPLVPNEQAIFITYFVIIISARSAFLFLFVFFFLLFFCHVSAMRLSNSASSTMVIMLGDFCFFSWCFWPCVKTAKMLSCACMQFVTCVSYVEARVSLVGVDVHVFRCCFFLKTEQKVFAFGTGRG